LHFLCVCFVLSPVCTCSCAFACVFCMYACVRPPVWLASVCIHVVLTCVCTWACMFMRC
jgi:hypothetical protein